ncbi:MAG: putative Ig domain-containing protein, partial [Nitrospirota bacterium]
MSKRINIHIKYNQIERIFRLFAFNFLLMLDKGFGIEPPHIGHIASKLSHPNKPIEIKASIVDDVEVTGANVYYRKGTEGLFLSIPMSLVDGTSSLYSATIPASGVTFEGIQYYIEARDNEGIRYDPPLGLSSPYQIDVSKIFFKPNGPSIVAYIWAMVMDPKNNNILYLSADYGYYKSIDAGRNWKVIGGAAHGGGPALAVDPATPNIIYVAPLAEGNPAWNRICKSTDGGNNFIDIGLGGNQIYGITPDRANPGRLYVCRSEGSFWGAILRYGSLWRSDNSGQSFYELDVIKDAKDPAMSVITIDPTSQGEVLYGGTWGFGIYKSEDGGNTWFPINNGLPFIARILPKGITVNPGTSTIVYALEMNNGVYRSMDGGQSWTQINNGLKFFPNSSSPYFPQADRNGSQLVVDPNDSLTLYLPTKNGAYKSVDNGDNWVEKNNADIVEDFLPSSWYLGGNSMVIDHKNPTTIYYGGEGGIFKSTDKGEYWIKTNKGLHCVFAWTVTVGTSAGYVYLGTGEQRVYKTTDYGQTWRQIPGQVPNTTIGDFWAALVDAGPVVINPSTPTTIYAAGSKGWGILFNDFTIYKSTDDGNNWVKKAKGLPEPTGKDDDVRWYALAIDPVNPDILYCGGGHDKTNFGIYKTTNAGEDWYQTSKTTGRFWKIEIDPKNPNIIYAGSAYGPAGEYGVWKSTNAGEGTWTQYLPGKEVRDIAIHPWNSNILYVVTLDGLYKTTDAGQTWTQIIPGCRPISIEIDPFVPDVLYAENWEADNGVAIYRSPDNGYTWQLIKDTQYGASMSGDPILKIDALKIDPHIPNKVYFCTWGEGFWQSEVQPGEYTTFKVYAPKIVSVGIPFEVRVIAIDEDSWLITGYQNTVNLSVSEGNISPDIVSNFVNGMAKIKVTLDTDGEITITAKDKDNFQIIGTVTVSVVINRPPILASIGDKEVVEGTSLEFTITATDADNDILIYKAINLPSGAIFTNQIFKWTPKPEQIGEYRPTFIVSDGKGAEDTETVSINVGVVNILQTDKEIKTLIFQNYPNPFNPG